MGLPKGIIFDLDDTLIAYDSVTGPAWQKVSEDFVRSHAVPFTLEELLESLERAKKQYWRDPEQHRKGRLRLREARREVVRLAFSELRFFDDAAAIELADAYTVLQNEMIYLLPHSIETLERLKKLHIPLGMITNGRSDLQREKIQRFGLEKYFQFILVEEEAGYGKPDLRIYRMALEKLSTPPEETWMVGDNLVWDVGAPQSLGIKGIWVDYRQKGLPDEGDSPIIPDRIIAHVGQLLDDL